MVQKQLSLSFSLLRIAMFSHSMNHYVCLDQVWPHIPFLKFLSYISTFLSQLHVVTLFIFILIPIESGKCCLFVCIYLSIYRSIDSLSGLASLKKTDSHFPSSHHLPMVPQQSLGHYEPLSHPHWYFDWLDLLQTSCLKFWPFWVHVSNCIVTSGK